MSLVLTTSNSALRGLPRLADAPGSVLDLLVLAVDNDQCAGVDLLSGALVRAWSPSPVDLRIRPYDMVRVTLSSDPDRLPDPAEPEGLVLDSPPEVVGRLTGRRAQRLLRPLLHPEGQPLLGFHGPAVAFWERRPDHPSIALVEPEGPILMERSGEYLGCRFSWGGMARELPCMDRRLAATLDRTQRRRAVLGAGTRLVVALTPPIEGHCHKVVEAVLPRR